MKQAAQIKELLNNGMHSKCAFHFTAENKREVCLVCVRPGTDSSIPYSFGGQLCVIGSPDDPVLWACIEVQDFYALMMGKISLPSKLKFKEIIL